MAKHRFKILDSDMHIMEPPDLWERYIDGKDSGHMLTGENCELLARFLPSGLGRRSKVRCVKTNNRPL